MRGNHKNANSGGNSKIPRTTESEKLKLTWKLSDIVQNQVC
jgi:hypothetical protein